eukprot:3023471-Prymnesium_polylepis.3
MDDRLVASVAGERRESITRVAGSWGSSCITLPHLPAVQRSLTRTQHKRQSVHRAAAFVWAKRARSAGPVVFQLEPLLANRSLSTGASKASPALVALSGSARTRPHPALRPRLVKVRPTCRAILWSVLRSVAAHRVVRRSCAGAANDSSLVASESTRRSSALRELL